MPLAELGRLVIDIRTGNAPVPAEFRDELFDEMGFAMDSRVAVCRDRYMHQRGVPPVGGISLNHLLTHLNGLMYSVCEFRSQYLYFLIRLF